MIPMRAPDLIYASDCLSRCGKENGIEWKIIGACRCLNAAVHHWNGPVQYIYRNFNPEAKVYCVNINVKR